MHYNRQLIVVLANHRFPATWQGVTAAGFPRPIGRGLIEAPPDAGLALRDSRFPRPRAGRRVRMAASDKIMKTGRTTTMFRSRTRI